MLQHAHASAAAIKETRALAATLAIFVGLVSSSS